MYPLKNIAMLVFISCAKTMAARCSVVVPEVTVPKFETEAVRNALEMSQYSILVFTTDCYSISCM